MELEGGGCIELLRSVEHLVGESTDACRDNITGFEIDRQAD